jgi:fatty acid desaturase
MRTELVAARPCPQERRDRSESAIRRSYLRFPRWSQPLWTLLTGKPLCGERPQLVLPPIAKLLLTLVTLVGLTALHLHLLAAEALALRLSGWLLAPVFMVLLAGAWRSLQVVFGHHAVHGTLLPRRPRANALCAKLLTLFTLVQNEKEYEQEHLDHHRRAIFSTLNDADASLLYRFGIRPGVPESELRKVLLKTLVSPVFHGVLLAARVSSNLRRPLAWRALAVLWMAWLVVGLPLQFGVVPTLLAVWLPLVVCYQISALLQFSTEHVWLLTPDGAPCMTSYAQRCYGRFCGEPLPGDAGRPTGARAWLGWWARTLFAHIPVRFGVLVGDLPAHDWHHLCILVKHRPVGWPTAIFERQKAIDSGVSAGMEQREIWGLGNMISHVLRSMAAAPAQPLAAAGPQAGRALSA